MFFPKMNIKKTEISFDTYTCVLDVCQHLSVETNIGILNFTITKVDINQWKAG